MTTQTPDAVREAENRMTNEDRADLLADEYFGKHYDFLDGIERDRWRVYRAGALAALDSRAGDAGEGDRYTLGYAQGQADAAQLCQWMQDKAWQDAVLMLVHYQGLAERTWLVGHEAATAKLAEWWRHARALSKTKSIEDIAATPAPTVDAVPAGEVRKMVETLRGEMAAAPKRDWYPVHRDYLDAILSASLSHGEGRK